MAASVVLSPNPVQQYFASNGTLLAGGRLFTYAAGTTNKQAAYSDSSGATPLPNPIVLNARGEVATAANASGCGLWLDQTLTYKLVLAPPGTDDPPSTPFWTVDNVVNPVAAVLAQLAAYEATIAGVPTGTIIPYGGTSAPTGWLMCFGQAVSRTTYSALFAAIATTFGVGDGSSTFNLPDLRGRAVFGQDNMGGTTAGRLTLAGSGEDGTVLGNTGGDEKMQQHLHNITDPGHGHTVNDPGHVHLEQAGQGAGGSTPAWSFTATGTSTATTVNTNVNTTGITNQTNTTGISVLNTGTGASQNMPPNQVCLYIIKT